MKSKYTDFEYTKEFGPYDSHPFANIERNNGECILKIRVNNSRENLSYNQTNNESPDYEAIWKTLPLLKKVAFCFYLINAEDLYNVNNDNNKPTECNKEILEEKVSNIEETWKGASSFYIEQRENKKYYVLAR